MEFVLRAAAVYFGILIIMRMSGKRTLAEVTTFDFVLLVLIAEATGQALVGDDFSVTSALLVITTLVALDVLLGRLSFQFPFVDRLIDGVPMVVVANGAPVRDRLNKLHISEEDVLSEARRMQGLERMDQIKYAVLEKSGGISIIPKR